MSRCETWGHSLPISVRQCTSDPSFTAQQQPSCRTDGGGREEDEEVEGERKEGALPLLEPRGGAGEPGTSLQHQTCRVSLETKDITTR